MRITGFTGGKSKANTEKLIFGLDNDKLDSSGTVFGWGYDGDNSYIRKMALKPFKCKKLVIMLKTVLGEMKYKEVPLDNFKPSFDEQGMYMYWRKEFTIEGIDGNFWFSYEASLGENSYVAVWIDYNGTTYEIIEGTWSDDGTYCDGTVAFLI